MVGYAYIMTHPGVPCVLWDHLFQHSQKMKDLIALRKRAGLHSRSKVSHLCTTSAERRPHAGSYAIVCLDMRAITLLLSGACALNMQLLRYTCTHS